VAENRYALTPNHRAISEKKIAQNSVDNQREVKDLKKVVQKPIDLFPGFNILTLPFVMFFGS